MNINALEKISNKHDTFFVLIILVGLLVLFSSDVLFYGYNYTATDYLFKFSPWDRYPPDEFGNYNTIQEDVAMNAEPYRRFILHSIAKDEFPTLWNPYSFAGEPFTHGIFFQPIKFWLFVLPPGLSFNLMFLSKILIAGIGTFYFAREIKLERTSAIASSLIFMFSGSIVLYSLLNSIASVTMITPLLFLFTKRFAENNDWKNFTLLSTSIALLILGGHPQTSAIILYGSLFYFIFLVFSRNRKNIKGWIKNFALFGGSTGIGLLLSSIFWMPFLDMLTKSVLWTERTLVPPIRTIPLETMITFLLPNFYGNPTFGRWGITNFATANLNHVGIVAIFLALIGSLIYFRQNKQVKIFVFLGIFFFGVAYGFPVLKEFFFILPGMSYVKFFETAPMITFPIAILGGFGLKAVFENKNFKNHIILLSFVTALLLFITIGLTFNAIENPPSQFFVHDSPLEHKMLLTPPKIFYETLHRDLVIFSFFLISSAIITSLAMKNKMPKRIFQFLMLTILVASLFEFGMGYNSTSKSVEPPLTPSIKYLQNDKDIFRVFPTGTILPPDSQMNFEISSIKGNNLLRPPYFPDLFKTMTDMRAPVDQISTDYSSHILDMLNVKYILTDSKSNYLDYEGRFKEVFSDKSVRILENTHYLPRAHMIDDVKVIENELYHDWADYEFLKGWIKGNTSEPASLKIYGPSNDDYKSFSLDLEYPKWQSFVINLERPDKVHGNPDFSKGTKIEITSHKNSSLRISQLQFVNEYLELKTSNHKSFWKLDSFSNGNLSCELRNDKLPQLDIKKGGNQKECFLFNKFEKPMDLSKFSIMELWMNNKGVYQLYIFGPTQKDYFRYDVFQYTTKGVSKVNINLQSPIEIHGKPDLSKAIKLRLDPKGGRLPGSFTISDPVLHKSNPIEILYKIHHSYFELEDNVRTNQVNDNKNIKTSNSDCIIVSPSEGVSSFDPRYLSKIPTHQPKDLFFFKKSEEPVGETCKVELDPSYSETLQILRDPDFSFKNSAIINEEFDTTIINDKSGKYEVSNIYYKNDKQKYLVTASQPGLLFVSDLYYPSINAYIDGEKTKIYRTNWAFRGVVVPEGEHSVEFKYEPRSFEIGLITSLSTAMFLVAGSIYFMKKRSIH